MANRTIDVIREGQVFTIYQRAGKVLPISSFHEPPAGDPVTVIGEGQLRAQFPGTEFRFVTAERSSPPPAAAHEIKLSEKQHPRIGSERQAGLIYFQRLLDRYRWCDEGSKTHVRTQCEASAHLLIEMFPGIEAELEELKAKAYNPGFKLDE